VTHAHATIKHVEKCKTIKMANHQHNVCTHGYSLYIGF